MQGNIRQLNKIQEKEHTIHDNIVQYKIRQDKIIQDNITQDKTIQRNTR